MPPAKNTCPENICRPSVMVSKFTNSQLFAVTEGNNEQNEIYLVHAFVNVRNMCTLHVYRDE